MGTKETIKDKPKLTPEGVEKEYDKPIKADKWVNLWFAKDGYSWRGDGEYDTKEAARERSDKNLKMFRRYPLCIVVSSYAKRSMVGDEVSHAIQIPIVD